MERLILFIRHPSFQESEWQTRNPYLEIGEVGFKIGSLGRIDNFKVGPGRWNELPYQIDDVYTISTPVTNPIGDVTGVIAGEKLKTLLEKAFHPYATPQITNLTNNAGGQFANIRELEIGLSLSGSVQLNYLISNTQNLLGNNPVIVSAGGIFNNEGTHPYGSIVLNLSAPIALNSMITININVSATHQRGVVGPVNTRIQASPKIIWGVSSQTSYTANDINNLLSKQTLITRTYQRNYTFNAQGYCVVAIPSMLNPSNMVFTDVTDPSAPAGFSMVNLGTLNINNGVGTYQYVILRSTYFITQPTSVLKIA
jgi:hypothetical protein